MAANAFVALGEAVAAKRRDLQKGMTRYPSLDLDGWVPWVDAVAGRACQKLLNMSFKHICQHSFLESNDTLCRIQYSLPGPNHSGADGYSWVDGYSDGYGGVGVTGVQRKDYGYSGVRVQRFQRKGGVLRGSRDSL